MLIRFLQLPIKVRMKLIQLNPWIPKKLEELEAELWNTK